MVVVVVVNNGNIRRKESVTNKEMPSRITEKTSIIRREKIKQNWPHLQKELH